MSAFTIHASKGGQSIATVRISPTVTAAKAQTLADAGWEVHVTDVDGRQHGPDTWDDLLIAGPGRPLDLGY